MTPADAESAQQHATATADDEALQRMLRVVPVLSGLRRAGDVLPMTDRQLLHAGPPLAAAQDVCRPLMNSIVTAVLFEGWAHSPEAAEMMVRSGAVALRPAQDFDCALPLADVLSPSMWLQVVRDQGGHAAPAYSPLNGGAAHPMRVGISSPEVLAHLHWLNGPFAKAYSLALPDDVPLIDVADVALSAGDDCHGRTAHGTARFVAQLGLSEGDASGTVVREFIGGAPGFFLNVWMGATRCILSAARRVAGSSVLTAAAGNGSRFGIQVAGLPQTWFTAPAEPPALSSRDRHVATEALGAIGDSAIVDCFGLGAMTTCTTAAPAAAPAFADVHPDATHVPAALLMRPHAGFPITAPLVGTSARRIASTGEAPIISLGVLDRTGLRGRLAGGFYRPPLAVFRDALLGLTASKA